MLRTSPPTEAAPTAPISIRVAVPGDELALRRLAILDGQRAPAAPVLLAERDGKPRAALSLADGRVVADPFHAGADLVELLRLQAGRSAGRRERGGRHRRLPSLPATPPRRRAGPMSLVAYGMLRAQRCSRP